jgi:glutamyl-tRNA reductase
MTIAIAARGVDDVCVANRTLERAQQLAARVDGRVAELDALGPELAAADIVLASTGSSDVLLERAAVETVMRERPERPLLIVDVALPRDIDPGVGEIPGVTLLDLDDLKGYAQRSTERRRKAIGKARDILTVELDRYRDDRRARLVAPIVTALRGRGKEIRDGELDRYRARLDALDDDARETVEAITQAIVNKLLHEPTVRLKEHAGTDRGDLLADALSALFDLDPPDGGDSAPPKAPSAEPTRSTRNDSPPPKAAAAEPTRPDTP